MRRTKIVATIGPASRDRGTFMRLLEAGADVLRLNFSHGEPAQHKEVIELAREASEAQGRALALLQDLSGPKIRTGRVRDPDGIELKDGSRIVITTDESVPGTPERIATTYDSLPRDVKPGDRILLDDGNLELRALRTGETTVECEVVHGGRLTSHKGMNLPGVKLSTPALTEKDRRDLALGVENGVDYIALSFVRQPADVLEARTLIAARGARIPVIAKIEKREAVDQLAAILEVTDGVMVARGDLGVELSTEEVPTLQKRIIQAANAAGKVVITATQMLESMIDHARPTRAEASDVANAILDGTDAIMLSAETATGRFPVESVETMARIAGYTEEHEAMKERRGALLRREAGTPRGPGTSPVAQGLARVAATLAAELECRLIVAFTESGATARLVSSFRPRATIVAITHRPEVYRQLALYWGVTPLPLPLVGTTDEMILGGQALLKERGLVRVGERVLMLAGQTHSAGATNMLRVHTIS
jgi:pyruvate kinase